MSTRLSLEASKKIFDLIGEYETGKVWGLGSVDSYPAEYGIDPEIIKSGKWNMFNADRNYWFDRKVLQELECVPAPSFAELVRVLPRVVDGVKERLRMPKEAELEHHLNSISRLYMSAPTEPEGMDAIEKYLMDILK